MPSVANWLLCIVVEFYGGILLVLEGVKQV